MGLRGSWHLVAALILVPMLAGVLPLLIAYRLISSSQTTTLGQIEARTTRHNLDTAASALATGAESLRHTAEDYGIWTLMDQAMRRSDRTWLNQQVGTDVLQTYGVETILVLDQASRPFYLVGQPLPVGLLPRAVLQASDSQTAVVNPAAPILIASSPIEMEQGPAMRAGTIIFANRLDRAALQQIAATSGDPVAVLSPGGTLIASSTALAPDIPWKRLLGGTEAAPHLERSGTWGIIAQRLIPSAGAKSPLLALIESRTVILAAGHDLRARVLQALALALGLALAGGLILSRYLLGSIVRLSRAIAAAAAGVAGTPLPTSRLVALGEVVHNFNTLSANLEAMVQTRTEIALRDSLLAVREREMGQLREMEQTRREFMANTSHELRTPLTVVQGYLELIEGNYASMSDEQRLAGVSKAAKGAQRLARLVEDVLLMLRMDEGNVRIDPHVFDLPELLRDLAGELPVIYPGQQVILEIEREPLAIRTDRDRLRQILTNLLDNAAKYSPEGASITLSCLEECGAVRLAVRDHGPGIPPELHERLFQRFGKVGGAVRAGRIGTGLGLAVSKALATLLGGRIELESAVGAGSTFTLVLPASVIAAPPLESQPIEGERSPVSV